MFYERDNRLVEESFFEEVMFVDCELIFGFYGSLIIFLSVLENRFDFFLDFFLSNVIIGFYYVGMFFFSKFNISLVININMIGILVYGCWVWIFYDEIGYGM